MLASPGTACALYSMSGKPHMAAAASLPNRASTAVAAAYTVKLLQAVIWLGTATVRGWMGCHQESGCAQSAESGVRIGTAVPSLCHEQCVCFCSASVYDTPASMHIVTLLFCHKKGVSLCLHGVPANMHGSAWLLVLDMLTCSQQRTRSTS